MKKHRDVCREISEVDPPAQLVISQLNLALSMARYLLPRRELLSHLILMALIEARKKPRRQGKGKAVSTSADVICQQ